MNRRHFFRAMAGISVMAIASRLKFDDGIALNSISHPGGFGLAPIKAEGASIDYDVLDDEMGENLFDEDSLEQLLVEVNRKAIHPLTHNGPYTIEHYGKAKVFGTEAEMYEHITGWPWRGA